MRTRSCGWRSYTRRPSTVKTSPWSRRGRSSSSSRKSLLKEIDLARPGPCVAGGPSGTAILGVRHIEGHVVELPTSGLGAESAEQFGERRHRATDRRDHQRLFVAIAEDRRRANAFSGDEHARSRDRGPHVARCDLAPFPAMPQLNEPSDTLQDGSLLRGGRPDRQLTGSGGRLASRQRSDARKPEVPRGPMDGRVVGRGREPEHAEPSVTRVRDAVRDERRRDPLRRHRGATRPPSSHASVGDTTVSFPMPTMRPPDSATKKGPVRWVTQLSNTSGMRSCPPQIVRTAARTPRLSERRARRITRSIDGMLP